VIKGPGIFETLGRVPKLVQASAQEGINKNTGDQFLETQIAKVGLQISIANYKDPSNIRGKP